MLEGVYRPEDPAPGSADDGSFQRAKSTVRNWIAPSDNRSKLGRGRYHLYAAWNCPWAHRVLLVRAVKGLSAEIGVSYALPRRTEDGWVYDDDPAFGVRALHEVYARIRPGYTGRVTVPLLWDMAEDRGVSNESADLVRMLDAAFPDRGPNLAPAALVADIDAWNKDIYAGLNNGVYRAGFARTQDAYEAGCRDVFATLNRIEDRLSASPYLCGDTLTEADLRLFPTLARFDVAYHGAFKCNIRRLVDYPATWAYARRIYALPEVADTVRFDVYKAGYYSPSPQRNPLGIVPLGPEIDWSLPADVAPDTVRLADA
ncbi:MAG: glutathione S-transferase C-terminal domain-containing protein [Pseudomonadota bacterium]